MCLAEVRMHVSAEEGLSDRQTDGRFREVTLARSDICILGWTVMLVINSCVSHASVSHILFLYTAQSYPSRIYSY